MGKTKKESRRHDQQIADGLVKIAHFDVFPSLIGHCFGG